MNTNETREVIKEIQEHALRNKRSVEEIIDQIEHKIGQGDARTDLFRRELKLMRYPMLTRVEEEFKDCLKIPLHPTAAEADEGAHLRVCRSAVSQWAMQFCTD